jgi:hypothetical protein
VEGRAMTPEQIRALGKQVLDSEPGGMEGPDIAELAMLLVSTLVFNSPPDMREKVVAQLEAGFHNAIAEGMARGTFRDKTIEEASKATKQ